MQQRQANPCRAQSKTAIIYTPAASPCLLLHPRLPPADLHRCYRGWLCAQNGGTLPGCFCDLTGGHSYAWRALYICCLHLHAAMRLSLLHHMIVLGQVFPGMGAFFYTFLALSRSDDRPSRRQVLCVCQPPAMQPYLRPTPRSAFHAKEPLRWPSSCTVRYQLKRRFTHALSPTPPAPRPSTLSCPTCSRHPSCLKLSPLM